MGAKRGAVLRNGKNEAVIILVKRPRGGRGLDERIRLLETRVRAGGGRVVVWIGSGIGIGEGVPQEMRRAVRGCGSIIHREAHAEIERMLREKHNFFLAIETMRRINERLSGRGAHKQEGATVLSFESHWRQGVPKEEKNIA